MNNVGNETPAPELTPVRWVKSRRSGPTGGNCVEVAALPGGAVAVRDSRHPAGPALVFSSGEWRTFIAAAKGGESG